MSIHGSEREFIFSLYLRNWKCVLEETVKLKMTEILLEKYWQGHKLDMFGYDKRLGIPIVAELWLGQSNEYHQQHLLDYINELDEGELLYLALSFQDKHIRELQDKIAGCKKSIKLSLVEIDSEVLKPLENLNKMHKLDVYWNLNVLTSIVRPLRVLKEFQNPKFAMLQPKVSPNNWVFDFSKREDINRYLLYQLRERIPNFLPLQREKRFTEENRIIRLGGGRAGIDYFISARNVRNLAFCELRFDMQNSELFRLFSMKPWLLKEKLDERIQVKDNAIGCYFKPSESVEETVEELVQVFRRMVNTVGYALFDVLRFEYQRVCCKRSG